VIRDESTGVTYSPYIDHGHGTAGYEVNHPDGRREFIYLCPSNGTDDGVPNVFLYQGETGDPAGDSPSHHYVVLED
jgi:hypothetical protein